MGTKQILQLQVRVDLGVMIMKGYSTLLYALDLEPNHDMQFVSYPEHPWGMTSLRWRYG